MNIRNTLYILTLLAYTLSLAHSVIPHHHHTTADEAVAHSHSDSDQDHHRAAEHHHHGDDKKNSEKENSESSGHLFFFSHDLNADVLIKHSSVDNPVKIKKTQNSVPLKEQIISFAVSEHLVFHPPQDDSNFLPATLASLALRGPPSC